MRQNNFSDIIYLDPNEIQINRENRQRKIIDTTDILESIRQNGIINPIIIREYWTLETNEGPDKCEYWLVAGERRLEACKQLNILTPCRLLSSLSPLEAKIIEFEENHKRKNLPWRDEVCAIGDIYNESLKQTPPLTREQLCISLSLSDQKLNQIIHIYLHINEKILTFAENLTQATSLLQRFKTQKSSELEKTIKKVLTSKPLPDYLKPTPLKLDLKFEDNSPQADFQDDLTEGAEITLYEIECETKDHIYVGITSQLEHRYEQHKIRNGTQFTKRHGAKSLKIISTHKDSKKAKIAERNYILLLRKINPNKIIAGGGWTSEHVIPKPKLNLSLLNTNFIDWVKDYSGPKFNFIHCDFPTSDDNFWPIFNCFVGNLKKILDNSAHIMFWFDFEKYDKITTAFGPYGVNLKIISQPLIWYKSDTKPNQIHNEPPKSTYETCLILSHNSRPFKKQIQNAYHTPRASQPICPNQKSTTMLKYFFQTFIDEDTNFFDPSFGSGSSIIAAQELKPKSILGLEINSSRFQRAQDRISRHHEINQIILEK